MVKNKASQVVGTLSDGPDMMRTGSDTSPVSTSAAAPEAVTRHEEICLLAPRDRMPYVRQMRIQHSQFARILRAIERCHQLNNLGTAEPECVLVVGPTGAGKTTVLNSYAELYPAYYIGSDKRVSVLQVTIPSNASVSALATAILFALGDPRYDKGTTVARTFRLKNLLRACGVELLLVDETQHFYDRDSDKVLQNASNWLKEFIKDTGVACVLAGLVGEAEQVVNCNKQLGRLFGDPHVLSAFEWDLTDGRGGHEFREFLCQLDEVLPLREQSYLGESRDTAYRIFQATGGLVAYVMALVRTATYLALDEGTEHLDARLLSLAFDQRLAGERRGIANPFAEI